MKMTKVSWLLFHISFLLLFSQIASATYCVGNAGDCKSILTPLLCREFTGCRWNNFMAQCQGFPLQCKDIIGCSACKSHGKCSWTENGALANSSLCEIEAKAQTDPNSTVKLAGIFDTSKNDWALKAFNLTIDLVNNKSDGWHDDIGVHIAPYTADAACDANDAIKGYWNLRPMHAVVGARCSGASISIARIAGLENVPQISFLSTSPQLSNNDEFPLFSRVVAPDDDRGEIAALQTMLRLFGWNRVSIISTDTDYGKDFSTNFQKLWSGTHENGWEGEIAFTRTISLTADKQVDKEFVSRTLLEFPTINSRIILLASHYQHSYSILKIAQEMNFQPDTIWIGVGWSGSSLPQDTNWMPDNPGYLGLQPYVNYYSKDYQDFMRKLYVNSTDGINFDHHGVGHLIDSIVAIAKALDRVPEEQRRNGANVTAALRGLNMEGVTGPLAFTPNGDRMNPQYSIVNVKKINGKLRWRHVGRAGTDIESAILNAGDVREICFAKAGCHLVVAPEDRYPEPKNRVHWWVWVVIPVFALVGIFFAIKYHISHKKKEALKVCHSDLQKKLQEKKRIDDELFDIDNQVELAKLRQQSLILRRGELQDKPNTWTASDTILVELSPSDEEYWKVNERLQSCMSDACISKLWRIQNNPLWSYYSFHKDRLVMNGVQHNERSVWHGTSSLDPSVIYNDRQDGFMMQYSNEGYWGRGIYFAEKSAYSHNYSYKPGKRYVSDSSSSQHPGGKVDEHEMFLTKLLIGKEILMDRDQSTLKANECRALTVPPIDPQTKMKYNTVTGHTCGSQVWIVYENGRAYPDYLVRYYRGKRDIQRTPYGSKKDVPSHPLNSSKTTTTNANITNASTNAYGGITWEFLDDNIDWQTYDDTQKFQLENAYKKFLIDNIKATIKIESKIWSYEVNFAQMIQTNILHPNHRVRKIRRRSCDDAV